MKHAQQKIRFFKKECKALLMTRMKQKEEINVVQYLNFSMTLLLKDRHIYRYLSNLRYILLLHENNTKTFLRYMPAFYAF